VEGPATPCLRGYPPSPALLLAPSTALSGTLASHDSRIVFRSWKTACPPLFMRLHSARTLWEKTHVRFAAEPCDGAG